MELSTLMEVKVELKRFEKRLDEAIVRIKADSQATNGAVKRAALDLKSELTKIT